jgi:hypothetical protein
MLRYIFKIGGIIFLIIGLYFLFDAYSESYEELKGVRESIEEQMDRAEKALPETKLLREKIEESRTNKVLFGGAATFAGLAFVLLGFRKKGGRGRRYNGKRNKVPGQRRDGDTTIR